MWSCGIYYFNLKKKKSKRKEEEEEKVDILGDMETLGKL